MGQVNLPPAERVERFIKRLTWILTFGLAIRGVDYVTGNTYSLGILKGDDGLSKPEVWGLTALVACAILVAGLIMDNGRIVQLGAVAAFAIYAMFAIQIFDMRMLPYPWPPEDIRLISQHLVAAGLWITIANEIRTNIYVTEKALEELERPVE